MLTLEFQLSSDDYVAYNVHAMNHLPAGTRQLRSYRASLVFLAPVATFVIIAFGFDDLAGGFVMATLAAATMWLLAPWLWRSQTRSNILRMSRDNALGTPGRHRLAVSGEGIREDGPGRTTIATWDMLQRVDETPDHLLIFTGPVEAFLIPRTAGSGQIADLIHEIRSHRPDLLPVSS